MIFLQLRGMPGIRDQSLQVHFLTYKTMGFDSIEKVCYQLVVQRNIVDPAG